MILRPFQDNPKEVELLPKNESEAVKQILREAGVIKTAPKDNKTASDEFKRALVEAGGDLDRMAAQLVYLAHSAENENVQISAIKMITAAQGALLEMDEKPLPTVEINITNITNNGNAAINLLVPRV